MNVSIEIRKCDSVYEFGANIAVNEQRITVTKCVVNPISNLKNVIVGYIFNHCCQKHIEKI